MDLGALGFGLIYTPVSGQPGFVADAGAPVQYAFLSDADIPEPGSFALVASAAVALAFLRRHRG